MNFMHHRVRLTENRQVLARPRSLWHLARALQGAAVAQG
jgi:hypothetical protein